MNVLQEKAILTNHWQMLQPILLIETEDDYDRALDVVEQLMGEVQENNGHPLYGLFCTLVRLIEVYEAEQYPVSDGSGIGALVFLMEEHGLTSADLPEVGSPETVDQVLQGNYPLNTQQIKSLAKRFHVSPTVFLDTLT